MNEGLSKLYIEKLKNKLEKVVSECLLKGQCRAKIQDLCPNQEFDYAILDLEKPSPVKVPIWNAQIYAIGEQIGRLEETLKD